MTDDELLFMQWWTIELGRSMDDPHEEELAIFLEGVRYASQFVHGEGETTSNNDS